ncbi:TRAF3-interacting JNK-activating modulator isoform X1 [Rissa tridactyla]|uniref:TRAF3-interacting JNK-activating modulator isoform X1 n=1 Tax=Rissa tridactyla TaxID=75485 RepID=UPI0023BA9314|nr:TRAF3-interacting JNK-activating modulator isoform X1 [Rissa tridactyla]XP_054037075.1 TRAF3-interacting JNK-activating modulator isoform X1 [Rissa tridactyla]XP_054037076.1 TRAF3-interacting JNK-activating modulator isoform X1 [Rissa tridactyla]
MISQPEKARPRHRHASESYDEKCERRHETRENLRRRNNVTTCRRLGRGAEEPSQSPRQREFLRRRNLASDAVRTPPGQEPKARVPPDTSSRVDPRLSILLQHPRSCPTFPPAHSPLSLSAPLGVSVEAVPKRGASVNTQGTQTLTNPSTGVKDSSQQTDCGIAVLNKEMVQLSNYLKEALHRELLLKQKMVILQELFSTLLQASEKSWQGQLNEDKLKCKLRALENQLQACTQSYSKECVKKILIEMEDQKQTYEQKAKEALQKMLEDKLQTEQQLQNSQRSLAATREDLAFWKEHYTMLKAELTKMTTTHTELENSFHNLQSELQRAAGQNEQLHQALRSLQSEHATLHRRASALREDNDRKAEHISTIEEKLQKEQNQKVTLEATVSHLHNLIQKQSNEQKIREMTVQRKDQVSTTQTPPLTPAKEKQNALLELPEEEEEESLKDEMQKRTSQLTAKENEAHMDIQVAEVKIPRHCSDSAWVKRCSRCGSSAGLGAYKSEGIPPANSPSLCLQCMELRSELEALSEEYRSCLTRLRQCRDELNHFQSKQAKRRRGHWIPLLVAVIAMAIATFLATYRP